jgi:hypothetical protein
VAGFKEALTTDMAERARKLVAAGGFKPKVGNKELALRHQLWSNFI